VISTKWALAIFLLLFLSFFFGFYETGSYYIAQAGFKLMILLPQPPEC
jgi:hypothetical protein